MSPDGTIGLNLGGYMYVGGVDPRVRVAPALQLDKGFHGCVRGVRHFVDWLFDSVVSWSAD